MAKIATEGAEESRSREGPETHPDFSSFRCAVPRRVHVGVRIGGCVDAGLPVCALIMITDRVVH